MNLRRFIPISLVTLVASLLPATSYAIVSPVHPTLVFNEINWAGSATNPNDQWIEIFNPDTVAVDFATDSYTLTLSATDVISLTAGSIPAYGHLLVSRLNPADSSAHSVLKPSLNTIINPSMVLSPADAAYTLTETSTGKADQAFSGLAGHAATLTQPVASQIRSTSASGYYPSGTATTSWRTSTTVGVNFLAGTDQYGTPADDASIASDRLFANPEVPAPTTPSITLSTDNANPVVGAHFSSPATQGLVTFTNTSTHTITNGIGDVINGFRPVTPLLPGYYSIAIAGADSEGNHSPFVSVPVHTSPTDLYLVLPRIGYLQAPVIDVLPSPTHLTSIPVTGTVQPGVAAFSWQINAGPVTVVSLPFWQSSFSFTTPLQLNASNVITVRAQALDGTWSDPATATVVQDSTIPVPLALENVVVVSDPRGTADSVHGLAAASLEPGNTVEVYGDLGLTQLIGTAIVGPDGSFGDISLGDDLYQMIHLLQRDPAGNVSPTITARNPVVFIGSRLEFAVNVSDITTTSATVTVGTVADAHGFQYAYGPVGSPLTTPVTTCTGLTSCTFDLTGLTPGTEYTVSVSALDEALGASLPVGQDFTTLASETTPTPSSSPTTTPTATPSSTPNPTPNPTPSSSPTPASNTPDTTNQQTSNNRAIVEAADTTVQPTPTSSASPTATATPENGQTKGVTTEKSSDSSSSSWLTWLIGILVLLVALYLFWRRRQKEEEEIAAKITVVPPTATKTVSEKPKSRR